MERVESYEALSPLLSAQLRRGVATNAFAGQPELLREISEERLWVHAFPGGLLLLRRREGFWRLNFYLQDGAGPVLPPLSLPVVTELAARPQDNAMAGARRSWETLGFRPLFRRERLARPKGLALPPGPLPVRIAGPEDAAAVSALLSGCFDPLTGCLPTQTELEDDLTAGNVVCADRDGVPAGILRISPGQGSTQLRQLAVAGGFRRRGAARSLLEGYLVHTGLKKSLVWVRQDNAPARAFYQQNGYLPDGWTATVLLHEPPPDRRA